MGTVNSSWTRSLCFECSRKRWSVTVLPETYALWIVDALTTWHVEWNTREGKTSFMPRKGHLHYLLQYYSPTLLQRNSSTSLVRLKPDKKSECRKGQAIIRFDVRVMGGIGPFVLRSVDKVQFVVGVFV